MNTPLILASGSTTRQQMLTAVGLTFQVIPARVDEDNARDAMIAEGMTPRDIADALAELKGAQVARKHPQALTLGADQTLDLAGECIGKPETPIAALELLRRMNGRPHMLHSAAVIYHEARPIWRHVATARMKMRDCSDRFLQDYVDQNWDDIRHSVGCYRIEGPGIRLFDVISTDYHAILGLPLMQILAYLTLRGDLQK